MSCRSGLRRLAGAAGATLVALSPSLAVGTGTAAAAAPAPPPKATPAPGVTAGANASLNLLAQSAFVESGQTFHLELQVTAPSTVARIVVVLGSRLTTRSGFDADVRFGAKSSSTDQNASASIGSLPSDPSGGIDLNVPINPTGSTTGKPFDVDSDMSGVYPVTVELEDSSYRQVGAALTTFLVYASPSAAGALAPGAAATGLPRLDVALSVPVTSTPQVQANGQPARLNTSTSTNLAAEAASLVADKGVPVTLDASPATLDQLLGGTSTDRDTLAELSSLAAGGDQIAEETYADVSIPSLAGAGLASEIAAQFQAGEQAVSTDLGHPVTAGTLTVNGSLDQTTAGLLTADGINQFVVPSSALSELPEADSQTTLASPTALDLKGPATAKVVNIDAGLTEHFTAGGDQVLYADRLLAELAMIQLETPGEHRGVAVVPPATWSADPTFLSTVLSGLSGNPLLNPVSTSELFSLPELGSTSAPVVRSLPAQQPTVTAFPAPATVRDARQAVDAAGSILPAAKGDPAALSRDLLLAESSELPAATQSRLVGAVAASLTRLRRSVSLPGGSSVTLTSRDGDVPITVVASGTAVGARVQLRLASEKLSFRPFHPSGGSCSSPTQGEELCQLTLTNEASTLKVPVEARASGVFTLSVAVTSPDGTVLLGQTRDTVRSTAFSGVGLVIMIVAGLGLAYWWIRNIRHGRRSRQLVPEEDESTDDGDEPPPIEVEPSWVDADPVIAEFFASPAPSFPPRSPPPHSS